MATLEITQTRDYRVSGMIQDVDRIEFEAENGNLTATFGSDQFEPGALSMSNSVRLVVSSARTTQTMRVVLTGTNTFSAANWIVDEDDPVIISFEDLSLTIMADA